MSFIHFIGIDVSQNWFDVAIDGSAAKPAQFPNDEAGFAAFADRYLTEHPDSFVVLEATGGHEMALTRFLVARDIALHRATPLMVRNFIRSLGRKAKTDRIDAQGLARFARERHPDLPRFKLPSEEQQQLNEILMRRADLVSMLAAEKARSTQPRYRQAAEPVRQSLNTLIAALSAEIVLLEKQLDSLIATSPVLKARFSQLTAIKGIGRVSAYTLQAFMPELGTLNRRAAASLAGCAPHPRESGTSHRPRMVFGGRAMIKRTLFLAAMTARRYDPALKAFFENLVARGKAKMTALTAVMRKIIIIANAKLRDATPQTTW